MRHGISLQSKEINKKTFCKKYVLFFSKMQLEKLKGVDCFTKKSIFQTFKHCSDFFY